MILTPSASVRPCLAIFSALALAAIPGRLSAAPASGDLLVADAGISAATTAVVAINPSTGARTIVSRNDTGTGTSFNWVAEVAVSPSGDIYVADTGGTKQIIKVNPANGDRTVISSSNSGGNVVGSGVAFTFGTGAAIRGIAWDPVDGTVLVADTGTATSNTQIVRVNPTTGARTTVTGNGVGSGSALNFINDVIVSPAGDIYIADAFGANSRIHKVDRATGNRTLISGNGGGSGTSFSGTMKALFWDLSNGTILVCDAGTDAATTALYRVNPSTGARTVLSRNDTGTGPALNSVNGGLFGSDGALYLIDANGVNSNVKKIDSSNGNRTLHSGNGAGSGTAASSEWRGGAVYRADTTAPAVQSINRQSPSSAVFTGGNVTYRVTFTERVFNVDASDFTLTTTGGTTGTIASISANSGTVFDVTVNSLSGNGTARLDLKSSGTGIVDDVGNAASGGYTSGQTYSVDTIAPTISIGSPSVSLTGSGSVQYTVTYSDANFNASSLSAGHVTLNKTGTADAGSISVSGTGNTRTVTLSSLSGNGTLGISIASGTATDLAGNSAGGAGPSTTFTVDTIAPTVSISSPSASITGSGSVQYTVTYSDANFNASSLSAGHITLNKTGTADAGSISISGAGNTRTVTLSSLSGNGTLGISIASGTATDLAGNSAGAAGPSTTFTVDNTAPTISIGSPSASLTKSGPVQYTVTYSDANFNASSLAAGHIALDTTGTADAGSISISGTGNTRTVTLSSLSGDGTLGISIASGTATDQAGNGADAAGPSMTFTVDNTPPTVSISSPSASVTSGSAVTYTITYNGEDTISLSNGDITLNTTGTATGTASVTGSGSTRTVEISGITGDGAIGISIAAGTALDTAGNGAAAAGPSTTFVVDTTNDAPTISGTESDQPVDDNATIALFANVTISDPDQPAQTLSVTVSLDDAAKGALTTLNGFTDEGSGVYTFSGTASEATAAIRGLVFDPADNRVAVGDAETTTFTIAVDDGIAAEVVDASTTVVSTSINDDPVAIGDVVVRPPGAAAKVSIAELIANDTDAEGHSLTLTLPSASSVNGAAVRIEGRWVVYDSPVDDNPDSFSYTISDGHGGSATGTVSVTVSVDTAQSRNILEISADGSDQVIRFAGIPGRTYTIQYTTDLGAPEWQDLSTVTAGGDGLFEYRDVNPPGPSRFYRSFLP